jgi:hypothetical protein
LSMRGTLKKLGDGDLVLLRASDNLQVRCQQSGGQGNVVEGLQNEDSFFS